MSNLAGQRLFVKLDAQAGRRGEFHKTVPQHEWPLQIPVAQRAVFLAQEVGDRRGDLDAGGLVGAVEGGISLRLEAGVVVAGGRRRGVGVGALREAAVADAADGGDRAGAGGGGERAGGGGGGE